MHPANLHDWDLNDSWYMRLLPKPPGESKTGRLDATTLRQSSRISLLRLAVHVSRSLGSAADVGRATTPRESADDVDAGRGVGYFQRVESPATVRNKRPERPDSWSPSCAKPDGCIASLRTWLSFAFGEPRTRQLASVIVIVASYLRRAGNLVEMIATRRWWSSIFTNS